MNSLQNKKILLAITGSIAAYKSAEIVRTLRELGSEVRVVMTEAAQSFITPMTLQTLSNHRVYQTLMDAENERVMSHIDLARWADLVVIAPATAHCLAKIALGLADDLLSTLCLATDAPIAIAPAMNRLMWENAATQQHVTTLRQRQIQVWGPAAGLQACGENGLGRMLEPEQIIDRIQQFFAPQLFTGKKILITAGPTQEQIDPVRYISNYSSGKMGYAMAEVFAEQGADVTLISGPTQLSCPHRVNLISVISAEQMYCAVMELIAHCDIFIAAAAVADYRVKKIAVQKIKKTAADLQLEFTVNPDILQTVAKLKTRPIVIGFAAETENVIANAKRKLKDKKLDMIIANKVGEGEGFQSDENEVTVITADHLQHFPKTAKQQLAKQLRDYICSRFFHAGIENQQQTTY